MDQEGYFHSEVEPGELRQGLTENGREIIQYSDEALDTMPNGKRGIVLGAGVNNQIWKHKGWETLDVDPETNPDYLLDANKLNSQFPHNTFDFVHAEYLSLHPVAGTPARSFVGEGYTDFPAVGHQELLDQSRDVLKNGGILIIKTVDFGYIELREIGEPQHSVPIAEEFAQQMADSGFEVVLRVENLRDFTDKESRRDGVMVTWYARKK